jgi:hypothetical protein
MSWHFLRGLEEASWEDTSLDGAPSALLNLLSTHVKYYLPDSGTDCCHPSQSGMMCELSTASRGEGWLMSSAGDFRVKTSAWPGKDLDWLAKEAAFGLKCSASFAKLDRDSCLWKTAQCSLFEDLEQSLEIWPRWGSMRDGECWALPTLEPRIYAKEFGLWPTLCKFDQTNSMPHLMEIRNGRPTTISSKGKEGSSPLRAWAAVYPFGALEVGENWPPEPDVARMVHGLANGVDRIGALGNGQVPVVAASAWQILTANAMYTAKPAV